MSERVSEPMSPIPPPPREPQPPQTGGNPAMRALEIARANRSEISEIRDEIGRPPNMVTGDRGSGMWGAIGAMMDRLSHVDATTTQILGRVTAIESGSSTRKGWFVSRGERVLDALLVAAFLALAATAVKKLGLW